MPTISADAQSYLDWTNWVTKQGLLIEFKRRGRRYVVLGNQQAVAAVIQAAKAVDVWVGSDRALRRKHEAALAAAERKTSATLNRELARLSRHNARVAA